MSYVERDSPGYGNGVSDIETLIHRVTVEGKNPQAECEVFKKESIPGRDAEKGGRYQNDTINAITAAAAEIGRFRPARSNEIPTVIKQFKPDAAENLATLADLMGYKDLSAQVNRKAQRVAASKS